MNRWKINSPFYELQTNQFGIGAALGIGGLALGAIGAYQSGQAAGDAAKSADKATAAQLLIAQRQMDLADEQWDLYKESIFPLELEAQQMGVDAQELALQRGGIDAKLYEDFYAPLQESFIKDAETGITPQYDRVSRESRVQVDKAYDQATGEVQRGMERRGVQPGSGNYRAGIGDISLNRAATKALGVQEAVDRERDRVETTNFNRKAVALGRQPTAMAPSQNQASGINSAAATAGYGNAGYTSGSAARSYGSQATMYGNAAAGSFNSAIQLGMGAYDIYNKYKTPAQPSLNQTGNTSYSPNYASTNPWANPAVGGPQALAEGGPVQAPSLMRGGSPAAYAGGGTVNGPPGIDQVNGSVTGPSGQEGPVRLTAGEYVIPADVVRSVGTDPLDEIIAKSRARKQQSSGPQMALNRRG